MEERINVAELLKDCPKGMELDCIMFEGIEFDSIVNNEYLPIRCRIKNSNDEYNFYNFTKYGCWNNDYKAKCVIFPKGKTTWKGFVPPCQFKDGDIVFTHADCLKVGLGNTWISIFQEKRNGGVATYIDMTEDGKGYYDCIGLLCKDDDIMLQRFATEEEKQKLFQAIKEHGYKWNAETKTLEKLIEPKFKVGNRVKKNKDYISGIVTDIFNDSFKVTYNGGGCSYVQFHYQNDWELVSDKFDINTLVPFESKVLVRNSYSGFWMPTFWGVYETEKSNEHQYRNYLTTKGFFRHCIPYNDDTKHLIGKTDDCDEYYKTWE